MYFPDQLLFYPDVKTYRCICLVKILLQLFIPVCILLFMAKQVGDIKITDTIDVICFYKMEGKYFVRMKSSLTAKRFWRDKAFEGSKRSCTRFASGTRLASRLYKSIEREKRFYPLFCSLKTRAIELIRKGLSEEDVINALHSYLQEAIGKKFEPVLLKRNAGLKEDHLYP